MTAEIAILNREAVAMAADSAATVSDKTGHKIFSSANKIFALSKHHPIGIMIYGNAFFMGVPWETIIKIYRKRVGDKKFDTVKEYANDFIEFLKNNSRLFPDSEQEKYIIGCIYGFFNKVKKEIVASIKSKIEKKGSISENEIIQDIDKIISRLLSNWEKGSCNIENPEIFRESISKKYNKVINDAIKEVYEKLPLSKNSKDSLIKIATYLFSSFPVNIVNTGISGVVISGFGEEEIFPSIVSFAIEGMANNVLKYNEENHSIVDYDNSAIIIPYAQQEMVRTFIDGISPMFDKLYYRLLKETVENYPKIILDNVVPDLDTEGRNELLKKIKTVSLDNLKKGLAKVNEVQSDHFVDPILKVVTFLPKNELAEMAESLVNLTCLRKKISMDDETVGGPIDVAVISKGDGLIWIKRKHYFSPELNRQFFVNYLNK
jgi:hypothetical protein